MHWKRHLKILTSGLHGLGVPTSKPDIDVVFVGSRFVTRQTFFRGFHDMLKKEEGVKVSVSQISPKNELLIFCYWQAAPNAFVPIIRATVDNVEVSDEFVQAHFISHKIKKNLIDLLVMTYIFNYFLSSNCWILNSSNIIPLPRIIFLNINCYIKHVHCTTMLSLLLCLLDWYCVCWVPFETHHSRQYGTERRRYTGRVGRGKRTQFELVPCKCRDLTPCSGCE